MALITVGIALSDANRADRPAGLQMPDGLPSYAAMLAATLGGEDPLLLELQPVDPFAEPARYPDRFRLNRDNRWLNAVEFNREVRDFVEAGRHRLGLHQPPQLDLLSSNYFTKYQALSEIRRAMDFANGLGAEYFVFNLAQVPKWEWQREDQIAKALKGFRELATYYRVHDFRFVPCVEVMEYPLMPATGGELLAMVNEMQKLLAETRIVLNLSHLWRSRNLMHAAGQWADPRVSFVQHLDYTLSHCWEQVHLFQLGGCWESETHAVPGLHPQQTPQQEPMKLRESAGVYEESGEMDLNGTLDLLVEYTVARGRALNLVLEIHDRDIEQRLIAARTLRDDLVARAASHRSRR